jgi:hypothetical protein
VNEVAIQTTVLRISIFAAAAAAAASVDVEVRLAHITSITYISYSEWEKQRPGRQKLSPMPSKQKVLVV